MFDQAAKAKMTATLKAIGHKPKIIGGNGREMPKAQKSLLDALGDGFMPEYPVATKVPRNLGTHPTCYKIDIANPLMMIAIEVDGHSHECIARKMQDAKKDLFLRGRGWLVYRVTNAEAIRLSTTYTSADILRILQTAS